MWHNRPDVTRIILHHTTQLIVVTAQRVFKERVTQRFGTSGVPLQLLSSQGKTQFCMPLHTREVLMHMLLWQKNALLEQGAETQTHVYQQPGNLSASFNSWSKSCCLITGLSLNLSIFVWLLYIVQLNASSTRKTLYAYKKAAVWKRNHRRVLPQHCVCPVTATDTTKKQLGTEGKCQRFSVMSRERNSRSAKMVKSIRKRLRRLVSSAHILTTPTPLSNMMSLATVLQNLACKKPRTIFFFFCLTLFDVRSHWSHVL